MISASPVSQHPGYKCMPPDSAFVWVLGIQIKVLMTAEQTLYQFSHRSPHCTFARLLSVYPFVFLSVPTLSRFQFSWPCLVSKLSPPPYCVWFSFYCTSIILPVYWHHYFPSLYSLFIVLLDKFPSGHIKKTTQNTHTHINNNCPYSFLNKL